MPTIKLLDFGVEHATDERMGRPRKLAWPVKAYRVTLPDVSCSSQSKLNSFERLTLRLLEGGGPTSAEGLSLETCIPEDFLKGVLLRLQDRGYIDERNNVRKPISDALSPRTFKPAMIFQEQVGGRVLPFLFFNSRPEQKDELTGFYRWQMQKGKGSFNLLTAEDVLKAMREQKRLDRAYGELSVLPAAESLRVSDGDEQYCLDCTLEMRAADGEFRIRNPFGKGYSLVLEEVFLKRLGEDEALEKWLTDWRESLARERVDAPARLPEPFDTAKNRRLYPQLVSSLRGSSYGSRSIEKIYSSIEWALFYVNERVSSRNIVNYLRFAKPSDTPLIVKNAAEAIGFKSPACGYPRVQSKSLDNYQEGTPEMPTALAIALLSAKSQDAHPLRKVAVAYPDAIVRLFQIKKERDIKVHGKGSGFQSSSQNELFMREFVSMLIPALTFSDTAAQDSRESDEYVDIRFDARTNLLARFGYATFNTKLSYVAQDRLVDAESFWLSFSDGEDSLSFLGDLYAALQNEFSRLVNASAIRTLSDGEMLAAIERKSKELQLGTLPACLCTVKPKNIRKALQGNEKTTLGGLVVAFMLTANEESLVRLLERDKTFFVDVGKIIAARGHLNEARLLRKDEIDAYRELAYKTLNVMLDYGMEE